MGKTAKILLSVLAILALVCVGGSALLFRKGKAVVSQLAAEAQREVGAARQWAAGHQQTECLDEALRRALACRDMQCQLNAQVFSNACLDAASPTPGLCDGVPSQQQFGATLQWQNQRCAAAGPGDAPMRCRNIVATLQQHCALRAFVRDAGPGAPTPAPSTPEVPAPTLGPADAAPAP